MPISIRSSISGKVLVWKRQGTQDINTPGHLQRELQLFAGRGRLQDLPEGFANGSKHRGDGLRDAGDRGGWCLKHHREPPVGYYYAILRLLHRRGSARVQILSRSWSARTSLRRSRRRTSRSTTRSGYCFRKRMLKQRTAPRRDRQSLKVRSTRSGIMTGITQRQKSWRENTCKELGLQDGQ